MDTDFAKNDFSILNGKFGWMKKRNENEKEYRLK